MDALLFLEAAKAFARNATPYDIMTHGKSIGLNRAYRRRLASKSHKGTLTPRDIPVWFLARLITGGTT